MSSISLDFKAFCREVLAGGEVRKGTNGREWWVRCPFHNDRNPSFSVNLETGVFHCFGCHESGSFRELVERLGHSWEEVLERYRVNGGSPRSNGRSPRSRAPNWNRIWTQSNPDGQVAIGYLRNRGLPVERLPECFREHRTEGGKISLLVKLVDRSRQICGFQRIFLTPDGQKAPEGKRAWPGSRLKGSFVLLGVGPEGLNQVEALAVAEGPETALAVHLATNLPTLIAVSASNLPIIEYPRQAKIIFFADRDQSGTGEREAKKAVKKLRNQGIKATYVLPPGEIPEGGRSLDFLDIFTRRGGPEEIENQVEIALQELENLTVEEVRFSPDKFYCLKGGGIWRCKGGGPQKQLSNFTARILEDVLLDFGNGETERFYRIEATLDGHTEDFWLKASNLTSPSWVEKRLGARARLAPGTTTASHLADAIKAFSTPRRRKERARAGWVKEGQGWRFRLPSPLVREALGLLGHPYELLEEPNPAKAQEVLTLLREVAPEEVAPEKVITGLLGAALFAPLSFFLRRVGLAQGVGFLPSWKDWTRQDHLGPSNPFSLRAKVVF